MQNVIAFSGPSDALEQAIRWADLLSDGSVTEADRNDFERWMGEAEANRTAFAEVIALWQSPALERALAAVGDRGAAIDPSHPISLSLGRAASRSSRSPKRLIAALAAAAAGVTILVGLGLQQGSVVRYETPVGGQRVVTLADGSRVTIAGDSAISARGEGTDRELKIHYGEAYFEVVHAAGAPFTVVTDNAVVTVLGTRFNVEREGSRNTAVSVFEGRVRVSPQSGSGAVLVLGAGEAAQIVGDTVASADAAVSLNHPDWIGGWLEVEDRSIDEVLRDLNRYSPQPVAADRDVGQLRVTGRFSLGEPERAVQALASMHDLRVEQGSSRITLRKRK